MENSEQQAATPGEMLRTAREALGISSREMADRLNWIPTHLIAVEENRFEVLRGKAFTRGYLCAYAKQVDIPETALLTAFESIQGAESPAAEDSLEVAMVGEAWAEVRRLRPDFSLYVSDGSHPNAAGSYLAACVIYAMVTRRSPVGAPRELTGAPWDFAGLVESSAPTVLASLTAADAQFLQSVAADVAGIHPGEGKQ